MVDILSTINLRNTPQKQPARPEQVKNAAGGYTFQAGAETRLRRFLVLGTDAGTYYASANQITQENAQVVIDYAYNDPRKLVDVVVEISTAGRAPKNDQAIFALAAASRLAPKAEDRFYANSAVGKVCRTGTHLFMFSKYVEQFGGWGPSVAKGVAKFYESRSLPSLGLQVTKYRQRDGYTHRDIMRLSHPKVKAPSQARKNLFDWICGRPADTDLLPGIVTDFMELQDPNTDSDTAVRVINRGNGVVWELLPTRLLNDFGVWAALVDQGIPMTALIRQLPRLTNIGIFKDSRLRKQVIRQLTDEDAVRKARIHPMNVLVALRTYGSGYSDKGSTHWSPNADILDALDAAIYVSFGNVEPTNQRILYALDVSSSMNHAAGTLPITCREAEGVLAVTTKAAEPNCDIIGFTAGGWKPPASMWKQAKRAWYGEMKVGIQELAISPRQRLDDVVKTIAKYPMGGTDCALPMLWAMDQHRAYDAIVICTDNETWAGNVHPHQALEQYRKASGINTKLVVNSFAATKTAIVDPKDAGSLDIAGLDQNVPSLISDFIRGF